MGLHNEERYQRLGSFLIMGVIGILVASIINIFLGSPAIAFAVSILGVLIFAGLTAYDTQNIKKHTSPMRIMAIRIGWTNLRSTARCSCI